MSTVRFKKVSGGRWIVGSLLPIIETDGSLRIKERDRGSIRSIAPQRVEVLTRNSRGTQHWVAYERWQPSLY